MSSLGDNGPAGDPDADSKSNLEEYRDGTNPTNATSYLRIVSTTPEDDDIRVAWTTVGGKTCILQGTADGSSSDYVDLATIFVGGTGESTPNYLDVGGATISPPRAYRVHVPLTACAPFVLGWGDNTYGQTNVPPGLSGVVSIDAGNYHNLAITVAPKSPSNLTAVVVSSTQVDLSWSDLSGNEDRFGIERSPFSTGPWNEVGTVDADVTAYSDTGVAPCQTYYYRVRAHNDCAGSLYSGTVSVYTAPPEDSDCDGIPNAWMIQYFGHPNGQEADLSRAGDDADGDGMTNLQEYLAGTDPTNNASVFRIVEVAPEEEDVLITWAAVGGKRYVLQTTTGSGGMFSNNFADLNPAFIAPGTGEMTMSVLHLGATTNSTMRFYRVRLLP